LKTEAYQTIAAIHQTDWWYRGREQLLLTTLRRMRRRAGRSHERWRILDAGCGFGALTHSWAEIGIPLGIDSEPDCITAARQRYPDIAFEVASLPDQLPQAEFDLIVLADVLEHLDEPERTLAALASRLKPRGWLLITVPASPALWTVRDEVVHHRRRYRTGELRAAVVGAGLRVLWMTHFNTLLFGPIWLVSQVERWFHVRLERMVQQKECQDRTLFVARPLLNRLLLGILRLELPGMGRIRFPVGVSLLTIAEKEG
jgi:2-polyprenyl-3-methyl-5-hydroxy-6-metoxy-1,4-benzoquinol methylase